MSENNLTCRKGKQWCCVDGTVATHSASQWIQTMIGLVTYSLCLVLACVLLCVAISWGLYETFHAGWPLDSLEGLYPWSPFIAASLVGVASAFWSVESESLTTMSQLLLALLAFGGFALLTLADIQASNGLYSNWLPLFLSVDIEPWLPSLPLLALASRIFGYQVLK